MDVPAVYEEIKSFDGCAQLDAAHNLKYVMGHTHCNEVTATDPVTKDGLGFMVAGQGMEGCGNYGIPIVETTKEGRVEITYFNVQDTSGSPDQYDAILKCFEEKGPVNCKELGKTWLNQTIGGAVF